MRAEAEKGVSLTAGAMTLGEFLRVVWLANHEAKVKRGQLKAGRLRTTASSSSPTSCRRWAIGDCAT